MPNPFINTWGSRFPHSLLTKINVICDKASVCREEGCSHRKVHSVATFALCIANRCQEGWGKAGICKEVNKGIILIAKRSKK